MEDRDAPAAARVRAAADLLDRGGYKAAEEHIITPGVPNDALDDAIAAALRERAHSVGSQVVEPGPELPEPSSAPLYSRGQNLSGQDADDGAAQDADDGYRASS